MLDSREEEQGRCRKGNGIQAQKQKFKAISLIGRAVKHDYNRLKRKNILHVLHFDLLGTRNSNSKNL